MFKGLFSLVVSLICGISLVACGGGNSSTQTTPVKVSFYGDSITAGASNTSVNGVYNWLKPSPVETMTNLSNGSFIGKDYSFPGITMLDAKYGSTDLPFINYSVQIKQDDGDIVVLRYATASALKLPNSVPDYLQTMTEFVSQAKAMGKVVVLTGSPKLADPLPNYGIAGLISVAEYETATEVVAKQQGVAYIDLRVVPFNNPTDTLDGVHPTREYSDRLSAYIVSQLKDRILK